MDANVKLRKLKNKKLFAKNLKIFTKNLKIFTKKIKKSLTYP